MTTSNSALVIEPATCVIAECGKVRKDNATGYCNMHYRRWKKHGAVGPPRALRKSPGDRCTECGSAKDLVLRPAGHNGPLCGMHYARLKRLGSVGPTGRLTSSSPDDRQCTHTSPAGEKCRGKYQAAGLCAMHYQRLAAGRDVDDPGIDIRFADDAAHAQMVEAGVVPLDPYSRSDRHWRCRCLTCGRVITPTLESVRRGKQPCQYCSGARVDPAEAEAFMLSRGLRVLDPWPGRVDREWRGIHVGTLDHPGCMGETAPTYHSVKTHGQGVCLDCGEGGYSRSKPGIFYIVSNERIVKCGITNSKNFARRINGHRSAAGLDWEYLVGFADGHIPWLIEKEWKTFRFGYPRLQLVRQDLRDGYTEAMYRDRAVEAYLSELINRIAGAGNLKNFTQSAR